MPGCYWEIHVAQRANILSWQIKCEQVGATAFKMFVCVCAAFSQQQNLASFNCKMLLIHFKSNFQCTNGCEVEEQQLERVKNHRRRRRRRGRRRKGFLQPQFFFMRIQGNDTKAKASRDVADVATLLIGTWRRFHIKQRKWKKLSFIFLVSLLESIQLWWEFRQTAGLCTT